MSGRRFFFSLMILAAVLLMPVTSQGKETLAVLDFTTEAVSRTEMTAIVEFLSAELFDTDKYIVIDVSQRETILNEMEFSMSGCSDDSCALEIGKMLSAEMIVTGNLSKVGSRYLMSVKMLETETSRTVGTANGKYNHLDDLIDGLESIAYKLASMEEEFEEPSVELEKAPLMSEPAVEVESTEPDKPEPEQPEYSWLAASLNVTGNLMLLGSNIFGVGANNSRILSNEEYEVYMSAANPEVLVKWDDQYLYEYYYDFYERDILASYFTAGIGGAALAASEFSGNTLLSFGGRITYAAGTLALTAANFASMIAANQAISNIRLYDDYQSAEDSALVSDLYTDYENAQDEYEFQQYLSYGLLGASGLFSIGSWFIPGEKTEVNPGFLQKILSAAGSIFMAAGNCTSQIALNYRFKAENEYDNYQEAELDVMIQDLYSKYEEYQNTYSALSITSYCLWGAGAAAVIGSMFLTIDDSATEKASADAALSVRPSLTGIGFEAEIRLR